MYIDSFSYPCNTVVERVAAMTGAFEQLNSFCRIKDRVTSEQWAYSIFVAADNIKSCQNEVLDNYEVVSCMYGRLVVKDGEGLGCVLDDRTICGIYHNSSQLSAKMHFPPVRCPIACAHEDEIIAEYLLELRGLITFDRRNASIASFVGGLSNVLEQLSIFGITTQERFNLWMECCTIYETSQKMWNGHATYNQLVGVLILISTRSWMEDNKLVVTWDPRAYDPLGVFSRVLF